MEKNWLPFGDNYTHYTNMKLRLPLALAAVILAACSFVSQTLNAAGESISINFGTPMPQGEVTAETLVGATQVAIKNWNQFESNVGSSSQIKDQNGSLSGVTLSWGSANTWKGGNVNNASEQLLYGYLDDPSYNGKGAEVHVGNIDYLTYDVYIYANTDASLAFTAKTVNGKQYTFKDGKTVEGSGDWGSVANRGELVEGQNYLKIAGNSDILDIYGGLMTNSARGGIAGIQIVNTYAGVMNNYMLRSSSTWNSVVTQSGAGYGQVFDVIGNGVTLDFGGAVTTDGIILKSGNLTLTGGSFATAGSILRVNSGSTLYLDLDFSTNKPIFTGGGNFSFIGASTWTGNFSDSVSIFLDNRDFTLNATAGSTFSYATIKGKGNVTKTGGAQLLLDKPFSDQFLFEGNFRVAEGELKWGNSNGVGNDFRLGTGTITVGSGATLVLHIKEDGANILNEIILENNSTLKDFDRTHNLKGGLTLAGGADSAANIIFDYDKTINIDGVLSGQGTLTVTGSYYQGAPNSTLALNNGANTFSGTLAINCHSNGNDNVTLKIAHDNAAKNAKIVLTGSAKSNSILNIATFNATIDSLVGNATSSVTSASAGNNLIITNGGDFAGTLGASFNLYSGGELILSGNNAAFTGKLVFSGTSLTLGHNSALGVAGNVEILNSAAIKGNSAAYKRVTLHGNTTINASEMVDGGLTLGTGQSLILKSDADANVVNWTGGLTFGGGTLSFIASPQGELSGLKVNGTVKKAEGTTSVAITLGDAYLDNGDHLLIDFGAAGLSTNDFSAAGFNAHLMRGQTYTGLKVDGGKLYAVLSGGTRADLSWNAGAGDWSMDANPFPWDGAVDSKFYAGDNVTFGTLSGIPNATVTIKGTVLPGGFLVNSDASTTYTFNGDGIIAGATTLVKEGEGTLVWNTAGAHTFYGGTDIKKGTILWKSGTFGAGKVNVGNEGVLQLWADGATASASDFSFSAPLTGTGSVIVWGVGNLSDSGESSGDRTILNLGYDFAGDVIIKSGLVSASNSLFGSQATIVLDGGGIVAADNVASYPVFSDNIIFNDIEVGSGGGTLRAYGSKRAIFEGAISGAGDLKHTDGGVLTFKGDMSQYSGAFTNARGTVNFQSDTHLKSFNQQADGSSFYGSFTIDGSVDLVTGTNNFFGAGHIGGKLTMHKSTLNISSDLTLDSFGMAYSNSKNVTNITSGNVVITGSTNGGIKNNSILLDLWGQGGSGTLNLSGGTFTAELAKVWMNADGIGTWNITGGEASVLGVVFSTTNAGGGGIAKGYLNLSGGGRLNLGQGGIELASGTTWTNTGTEVLQVIKFGDGILGATADWTTTAPIELTNDSVGLIVNTEHAPDPSQAGHTITLGGVLSGAGKLVKSGSGTLKLTGDNTFTGGVELVKGTLYFENSTSLAASSDLTINGIGGELSTLMSKAGTTVTVNDVRWNSGNLALDTINLTVSGVFTGAENQLSMKDSSLVFSGTNSVINLGILSALSGTNTIDTGTSKLVIGLGDGISASSVNLVGTGALKVVGSNAFNVTDLTRYVYAGTGGLNITGTSSGAENGIYGGSWDPQVEASGNIVIGSTNSGVTTVLDFGTADSDTRGIYGAGANLGDTTVTGSNATVLTSITIQGTLTGAGAITEAGKSSTTKITGRIYGGGNTGANVYGSTALSLSGIHFVGGNAGYPEAGQAIIMGGGHVGTTVFGNVGLTISDSIIDSKLFGGGGNVKGNVLMSTSGSLFTQNVYAGVYGGTSTVDGTLTFTDVGSTFNNSLYASRDGVILGDVSLSLSGTFVKGSVYGGSEFAGKKYEGNVTLDLQDSTTVEGSVYGSGKNGLKGNVVLNMTGTTVNGSVYGGGTGGLVDGKVMLEIKDSIIKGNVLGAASDGTNVVSGGVDMILNNVTLGGTANTGLVGICGAKNQVVTGDSHITIKGNSTITNLIGIGGKVSTEFTNTLEYGNLTGNLTVDISGGTIGAGLTGTESNLFSMVGRNSILTGNAYLNISGGTIKNEYISLVGVAGSLTGDAVISLSGNGTIESNIRATTTWAGKITQNLSFILDGGILGLAGATRSLESGSLGNGKVQGNVTITLDGDKSGGVGTVFKGDYSILAGATKGESVGGNTAVTLSNITTTGGVADFSGLISGANATGGGVSGASRTLTFDNYTTSTAAQYKYFTLATVKGASSVVLAAGASTSDIVNWDIQDTSSLTISKTGHLTAPSTVKLGEDASLIVNAGEAIDLGAIALDGAGTLIKNGTEKLSMSGNSPDFTGQVTVKSGVLSLTGSGNSFGADATISLEGGSLMTERSSNMELNFHLIGDGSLTVNNSKGVKTTVVDTLSSGSGGSFTGDLIVNGGILELASGVNLAANTATIGENGTLTIRGLLHESVGRILNSTAGKGTLSLVSDYTLNSGNQLTDFTGILSVGSNTTLNVGVKSGGQYLNAGVTVGFNGLSVLNLDNASGSQQSLTLGNLVLNGDENVLKFTGSATGLVITNGTTWMDTAAGTSGQLTFDVNDSSQSTITITNPSQRNIAFANIFLQEDGVLYQTQVNDAGLLVKLTLDQMTELPKAGVPVLGGTSYKITDQNTDLSDGVLTMEGDSYVSSMTILTSANNREWNLNGHAVQLSGGSLMFQGEGDYTISGGTGSTPGTLSSQSGIIGFNQMVAKSTLTLTAEIAEVSGSSVTGIKKMGPGKMIMSGKLSNKGGLQVVGGTLQLEGLATGNANSGVLSNAATLILGNGTDAFVSGYTQTVNSSENSQLIVNNLSVLDGTVMNAGTVTMKEGSSFGSNIALTNDKLLNLEIGAGKTMSLSPTQILGNSGVVSVKSGTLNAGEGMLQGFDVAESAQVILNLSSAVNTGNAMSGAGTLVVNNTSRTALDISNNTLGTKWNNFSGTLKLNSSMGGTFRVKVASEMGASLITVGKGVQFWDAAPSGTRHFDMELSGMGSDDFGTMRITKSSTYTGDIQVDAVLGARISTDNALVSFLGNISGGILELGTGNMNYDSTITLTGDNTHALTRVIGKGRVVADSATALGEGLDLSGSSSSAELKAQIEIARLTGVGGSGISLVEGSSLKVSGDADGEFAGFFYGKGNIEKSGLGKWTLSGENTQTGSLIVSGGTLIAGNEKAFGNAANMVDVRSAGKLDLGNLAITHKVTLNGAAQLAGASQYNGVLTVKGIAGEVSMVQGNLTAGSLVLTDAKSRLNVSGDVNITDGGSLYLDSTVANQEKALLESTGKLSLGGSFNLAMDTNCIYEGKNINFKLFEASAYPKTSSDYNFELLMNPAYAEFYLLKDNYKQEMLQSGSVTITVNVKAVVGILVDDTDVSAMGTAGYVSRGESFYLGAKENGGNPVYFDKNYTIAAGDDAYRMTNGEGWLQFATQMTGDKKLVISKYLVGQVDDRGVVIANNNNTYTGDTSVLNVHLVVDGSVNQNAVMPNSGVVGSLGTGAVNMLGRESILELRPNGDNAGQYEFRNGINLYDGASLVHSGGSELTLTGAITSSGSDVGVIANRSDLKMTLQGSLTADRLILKGNLASSAEGRRAQTGSEIILSGGGNIGELTLSDNVMVTLLSKGLETGALTLDKGTELSLGTGSELTFNTITRGEAGEGDAFLRMQGGVMNVNSNTSLGAANQIKLSLGTGGSNRINVLNNSVLNVSDLQATDGGLTKSGNGTLELSGNMSAYRGAVHIENGKVKVSALSLGSDLNVAGNQAKLEVSDRVVLAGNLAVNGGHASTGSDVVLEGDLTVTGGGQLETGQDNAFNGQHLSLQDGAVVTFGEGTQLGKADGQTQISMGNNVSLSFGAGSRINGEMTGGFNFGHGSSFLGELNVGNNDVRFENGSVFKVDGSHYESYTGGKTMLTGTGTISLDKGTKFELMQFAENMTPLPQTMGLISTTGNLLLDGQEVEAGRSYSEYLTSHNYVWLAFDLLGGVDRLDLYIQKDVRFDLFARTSNEAAIAGIASEIALHSDNYAGELGKLGTALGAATYDNVQSLLGGLAHSTSAVFSGYSVQMQNLRRHTLEIMNRAIQSKTENTRLSYEDTNSTIWANGISGSYKMDGNANSLGNTANIWGGSLGMSTTVSETMVLGVAFTYTNTDVRVDQNVGETKLDAYNIDLFARYHKDNWNITGVLTGGFTSHDIERNLYLDNFQSKSKSSADGNQVMAMVQAGYEFVVSDDQNSILEPFALISGGYSSIDGLTETGAGTAGLNVDSDSNTLCSLGAGVRFVREYMVDSDSFERGRFEARAIVMQDLTDMNPTVSASFQGAPNSRFQQEGVAPGKTALLLGVGVVHPLSQSTAVFADVDGEFRKAGTGVGANVGIKYMF